MPSHIRQTQHTIPTDQTNSPLGFIRLVYLGFIQGLFAAAPRGMFHWDPDQQLTEILITDESPLHTEVLGTRPGITTTRGPVQSNSIGQDDVVEYNERTGAKKKSVIMTGTMSINCSSRVDTESEFLAGLISEQIWLHRDLLMRAGFFEIGRQAIIGSPTPAGSIVVGDGSDEWYATTISSPFQYIRVGTYTPLGAYIANGITGSISANIHRVDPFTQGPAESPNGDPPFGWREDTAQGELPCLPHPNDPTKIVRVVTRHPYSPGLRPPQIRGRRIPLQEDSVEESTGIGPIIVKV